MNNDFEAELVAKARHGDPSAAPFLVSCFGERLLGYARGHAPDLDHELVCILLALAVADDLGGAGAGLDGEALPRDAA